MKNLKSIAIALVALVTITANAQDKKINAAKSKISWVGEKVTGKHSGTINVKDGVLTFKADKLTGGNVTVDMTSVQVTDLKAKKNAAALLYGVDAIPQNWLIDPKGIVVGINLRGKDLAQQIEKLINQNSIN